MKLSAAKKLHSGDEVTVKASAETVAVIQAKFAAADRAVTLTAVTREGFVTLSHREVR